MEKVNSNHIGEAAQIAPLVIRYGCQLLENTSLDESLGKIKALEFILSNCAAVLLADQEEEMINEFFDKTLRNIHIIRSLRSYDEPKDIVDHRQMQMNFI